MQYDAHMPEVTVTPIPYVEAGDDPVRPDLEQEEINYLASMYRTMDAISLQHVPNLGVSTEVRMFGAEISAEVASLSDTAAVALAVELDAAAQEQGRENQSLTGMFNTYRSQPPAAYSDDPAKAQEWALMQLRIGLVGRRFRTEYAQRFPERAVADYEQTEEFQQGNVVAFRTMGQFLSSPY